MQKFKHRSFHRFINVRKGVAETSDRCPILTLGLAACEQFPRASDYAVSQPAPAVGRFESAHLDAAFGLLAG